MVVLQAPEADAGASRSVNKPWQIPASWRLENRGGSPRRKRPPRLEAQPEGGSGTDKDRENPNPDADNQLPQDSLLWQMLAPHQEIGGIQLLNIMNEPICASPPRRASIHEHEGSLENALPAESEKSTVQIKQTASKEGTKLTQLNAIPRSSDSISSNRQQRTFSLATMSEISKSPARSESLNLEEPDSKRTRTMHEQEDSSRILVCPYSKFDPLRYSWRNLDEPAYRNCGTLHLRDISRLKQHLLRVHTRPKIYCSRCFTIFQDDNTFVEHVRPLSCELRQCPFDEKMTQIQRSRLKEKRAISNDRVQSWFAIYGILFPQAKLPKSPFADYELTDVHGAFLDLMERFQESFSEKLRRNTELSRSQKITVSELAKETGYEMASMLQREPSTDQLTGLQQSDDFVFEAGPDKMFQSGSSG